MNTFTSEEVRENLKYLKLLSERFPSIQSTCSEIINLHAILNLPKGTEHFVSDIHGEYEAFGHLMRNCSGSVKRKARETLSSSQTGADLWLSEEDLTEFCTLIYYPEAKLAMNKKQGIATDEWYKTTIFRLVELGKVCASKYSQSKIRKAFAANYAYITQELLFKSSINADREDFYNEIVDAIVNSGAGDDFIINFAVTIRRLCTDHLHIIGDIYDRGVGPQYVLDMLMGHHSLDIQWGNHDVLWIGAAAGNLACIANAVRICVRYGNMAVLEDGYGINLRPLTMLAMNCYGEDDDLGDFAPHLGEDETPDIDADTLARMQKAMAIIQFKLESSVIGRNPQYGMEDRRIIDTYRKSDNSVIIDGKRHVLNSSFFPTVDESNPCALTAEEEHVINSLHASFTASEKLRRHIDFMLNKGGMYLIYNNNLLLHAGLPLNEDLSFQSVTLNGQTHKGRALLDYLDGEARRNYYDEDDVDKDIFWYLWCSPDSPLFGKDKMATFERYYVDDKSTHTENYLPFYLNIENAAMAELIFAEFGIDSDNGHIICGHVPVRTIKGENPIKAAGKILCIDAGFAKSYHKETGVAGCTLTYNSYGMNLIIHEPFTSLQDALTRGYDIQSETRIVNTLPRRLLVKDTDTGKMLTDQIYYLEMLLHAYRNGNVPPKN